MDTNQRTPRRLPIVRFEGEEETFDVGLREFRTVTPPIRPAELIPFASDKGRQMLEQCTPR